MSKIVIITTESNNSHILLCKLREIELTNEKYDDIIKGNRGRLLRKRQNPIAHQEVIQMKNKKLLTFVSAALIAATAIAPTVGSVSAAAVNTNYVRYGTASIDGELDAAYEKSYSFKLSDLVSSGKLDMNKFQLQQIPFYDIAGYDFDTGYLRIFDENGDEITAEMFTDEDLYDTDYNALPEKCTFRWTEEGIKSPLFTDAQFYFLYSDGCIYLYVDVKDNDVTSLSAQEISDYFSSGWSGRPWLGDTVMPTFYLNDMPRTNYEIAEDGSIVPNETQSTSYSKISVTSSADGAIYYSDSSSGEPYFDTETASYRNDNTLTQLNDFCFNWWTYCCFQDGVNVRSKDFRDMVCDGSDTEPVIDTETGKQMYCYYKEDGTRLLVKDPAEAPEGAETSLAFDVCSTDFYTFLNRHVFNDANFAQRAEGREWNLQYVETKMTDNGYAVEMAIPLTELATSYIEEGGSVSFSAMICDAFKFAVGSSYQADGNAKKWYISGMTGSNVDLSFTKSDFASTLTPGDLNGDGNIDTKDLIRLMKCVSGQPVAIFNADVTNDNSIDTRDLIRLMKKVAGVDVEIFANDLVSLEEADTPDPVTAG